MMGWIFAGLLAALLAMLLLHNCTAPKFRVRQVDKSPTVRIAISRNFVVNSIYSTTITRGVHTLFSHHKPTNKKQIIDLSGACRAGDRLTVRCYLQYDQWLSVCGTMVEKDLVVR